MLNLPFIQEEDEADEIESPTPSLLPESSHITGQRLDAINPGIVGVVDQ